MSDLTPRMVTALRIASEKVKVSAGLDVTPSGQSVRIAASTLRALEQRGLVTLCLSSDGGMAARLTEDGVRSAAAWKDRGGRLAMTGRYREHGE